MKEKMPKKSGRWWFWRKRADSTIKQVITYILTLQKQTVTAQLIFTESDFSSVLHVLIFSLFIFSQSETKLETKEPHLEEEGPSVTQEKLSLPLVVQRVY